MFIHLLAGSLVFLFLGKVLGLEITRTYLVVGAFWGIVPDPISYILSWAVKFNKWAHTHRDNFSHSVFMPIIVLALAILFDSKMAIVASIAILIHPFLDLFGIGWGVKLFYPLSKKTFKMFYKRRILTVWNQKEVDTEAEKFGDNDWVRNIYFRPNIVGASEWLSLAGFLLLVVAN
ncbi:MAG: metal-dependent hydrolase [Candidatus Doudnabacteria bacterium]